MDVINERALDALVHLIREGEERGEAIARVAIAFQLTDRQERALVDAYDGK